MRVRRSLGPASVVLLALGCSGGDAPTIPEPKIGPPAALAKVAGDGQRAVAGNAVADSLTVRVTDAAGKPVPGVEVAWAAASGDGSLAPAASRTDAAGRASAVWTLGRVAGANTATAKVAGTLAATFSATDAAGVAQASWTLGEAEDTQTAAAAIGGTSLAATFSATARLPDPGRAPPVRLNPPNRVGKDTFPRGDTPRGGQGQTVDGIGCLGEMIAYHVHAHVSLFVNGEQLAIPTAIGIVNPVFRSDGFAVDGSCFYWMHTHEPSGIVHVEAPDSSTLTLGQLFDIWGQPLTPDNAAGFAGTVRVWVDGVRYTGDPRKIPFTSHREITIQVGTPLAPIPSYTFPAAYTP